MAEFTLSLTPTSALRCDLRLKSDGRTLESPELVELQQAFEQSSGLGLVRLGASKPSEQLSAPEAYWRDFGKTFLSLAVASGTPLLQASNLSWWLERAPAMPGGEYLKGNILETLWQQMGEGVQRFREQDPHLALNDFLTRFHPIWNRVGRVCLSLAENKRDPLKPFALLATYTSRLTPDSKPEHIALAKALKSQSNEGQRQSLAKMIDVLKSAAAGSPLIAAMLEMRSIFQPQALTIAEAYSFLKDQPALEAAGVMVRVPDWWQGGKATRPRVELTIGATKAAGSGLGGFLDFKAEAALGGTALTAAEWQALKEAAAGLVFLRGQWVEADAEQIEQVLALWRRTEAIAAREGLGFAQAMRLFIGGTIPGVAESQPQVPAETVRQWSEFVAGPWLRETLSDLKHPEAIEPPDLGDDLKARLRPYQMAGLSWLWRLHSLNLGGCLADDMGLGKTIQIIAFLLALKRVPGKVGPHLIVAPATLVANWIKEARVFAPGLRVFAAHPSLMPLATLRVAPTELSVIDVVVTSYGVLQRYDWILATEWDVAVLDEAQAIKNPSTQQTQVVKSLRARQRLALTGTPVENRPLDLWSIFDFINPGLLGTNQEFSAFISGGDGAFAALRKLVNPYILRRLKTDRTIAPDLPAKTELEVGCSLLPPQAALYESVVIELRRDLAGADGIKRKGVILKALLKLKQVCAHPALATGHGELVPEESGKMLRLLELAEEISQRGERLLVFTQFIDMLHVIDRALNQVFRRQGLVLHGGIPVGERQHLVERFQAENGPPYFVLSVKAGGTGLTLTQASHVIHFDRWWNPAVEDQATDRAHRLGQKRHVLVHKLFSLGTIEAKIANLITQKRLMAHEILGQGTGGEAFLTELSDEELLDLVSLDINRANCLI